MYSDPNCVLSIYDQNAGEQLLSTGFFANGDSFTDDGYVYENMLCVYWF